MWSSNGIELRRTNGITATEINHLSVYTDTYSKTLSTSDDRRVIECKAVINADPLIVNNDTFTLNVNGKYVSSYLSCYYIHI